MNAEQIKKLNDNIATLKGWIQTNATELSMVKEKLGDMFSDITKIGNRTVVIERSQNLGGITSDDVVGLNKGSATTFAALPAVKDGDFSILTADDIGTGTAANPQYPAGIYTVTGGVHVLTKAFDLSDDTGTFDTQETTLTSLQPAFYDTVLGWTAAQGTDNLSADALVVETGKGMSHGVYRKPGHGLTVGMEYVTDPNTLGGIIPRTSLAAGEPYQKLFTVPNPDEIDVDVKPLVDTSPESFVKRFEFDGFTGVETTVTVSEPVPDNVSVFVHRDGIIVREGITEDFVKTGDSFVFNSPLNPGEYVTIIWIEKISNVFREDITSLPVGTTAIPFTVNGGLMPADTVNYLLYRQNILIRETDDYTILGNVPNLATPTVAGDTFTHIIYN